MCKENMDSPLFIVGAQRSGSTIISLCLSKHSKVFLTVHGKLLYYLIQWIYYNFSNEINYHLRLDEIAYSLKRRPILGIPPDVTDSMVDRLSNDFNISLFAGMNKQEIIRTIWSEIYAHDSKGKFVIGDKYNEYLLMLEEVADVFPNARFIFIKRNFIDSSESMVRHFSSRAFSPQTYEEGVIKWLQWNKKWIDFSEKLDEKHKYMIRYEDMVLNPKNEMKKICDFLSLEPEESFVENANSVIEVKYNIAKNIELDFKKIKKVVPDYKHIISILGYDDFLGDHFTF